ncbi:MAG: non-ribosomal peptide synthetase, partial [Alphaproteobacteria bacterium]|nr:non-ribosomal peptide synthetase [Alphaproteobacteria bacterium]
GELWIGGAGVTRGYWNREPQTEAAFPQTAEGRLYRTGDLCRRDSDGRLRFLGRVDQQVKLRGYRIELGEIETRLARLPGVREVAVVARAEGQGERQLIGFVTGEETLDPASLRSALAQDLPDFMVPLRVHVLPAMPLTPNRKIDRKALATGDVVPAPTQRPRPMPVKPVSAVSVAPAADVAPPASADLQDRIGQLMARILGLAAVQPGDNFFSLGGHSLLAVQLHRSIREELGLARSSITDIFRFPILSDLAAHLAGPRAAPVQPANAAPAVTPVSAPATPASAEDLMAARRALRARMRPGGQAQ